MNIAKIKTSTAAWIIGGLLLGAIGSFYFVDEASAAWMRRDFLPGDAKAVFEYISIFGHGTGCLIAVLLIFALDPVRRSGIKFVLGASILTGVIATVMKVMIHRNRPYYLVAETGDQSLSEAVFNNATQSFPSGHTAAAFALAVALSVLYPRGAKVFFAFAVVTGLQRVFAQAHYPSDVFAGALIGLVTSWCVLKLAQRSKQLELVIFNGDSSESEKELLKKCA